LERAGASKVFIFKIAAVLLLVAVLAGLLSFPIRAYLHNPASNPFTDGFKGFSGPEKHSEGYQFAWASSEANLQYPAVPRYSPLNLRLKINLQRPPNTPPARLEIYENTLDPPAQPRLLTTLEYQATDPAGPRDFYLTIPARESGKGLNIEIKSNAFQVQGDRRQLGFLYLEDEISLPRTHFIHLLWPYPYALAGLLILTIITAWSLRAGLNLLETLLLTTMNGLVILTSVASTYQYSWWLLMIAAILGGLYWYNWRQSKQRVWPIFAACSLTMLFFLFNPDAFYEDITIILGWASSVHSNGIWSIYSYDPTFNYLPLIAYTHWLYNLLVYPFGWQTDPIVWRVYLSLLYLATVALIYLICRITARERANISATPSRFNFNPQWLILLAFNVGFFHNATIWAQLDMLTILGAVLTFYLLYRRQALSGGIALGLTAITKPQAILVLPLLVWMLIRRCGWRRGLVGLSVGGGVAALLSAVAFGFDVSQLTSYLGKLEPPDRYINNPVAYNLNYLILGTSTVVPPEWLRMLGTIVVGTVLILILATTAKIEQSLVRYGLAGALFAVSFFSWEIQMKERYLIFALPFLALAALQERKFFLPFLLLSWLQLIQLIVNLYQRGHWQTRTLPDNFYLWSVLLSEDWTRRLISAATLLFFFYLTFLYIQEIRPKRLNPQPLPAQEVVAH